MFFHYKMLFGHDLTTFFFSEYGRKNCARKEMRGIDVCLFQVSSKSAVIEKRPLMGMAMGMATGAGGGVGMGMGMGMEVRILPWSVKNCTS